jgi:hypothetical protein
MRTPATTPMGGTGLVAPLRGFGCMRMTDAATPNGPLVTAAVIKRALDLGATMIDSDDYGRGRDEETRGPGHPPPPRRGGAPHWLRCGPRPRRQLVARLRGLAPHRCHRPAPPCPAAGERAAGRDHRLHGRPGRRTVSKRRCRSAPNLASMWCRSCRTAAACSAPRTTGPHRSPGPSRAGRHCPGYPARSPVARGAAGRIVLAWVHHRAGSGAPRHPDTRHEAVGAPGGERRRGRHRPRRRRTGPTRRRVPADP